MALTSGFFDSVDGDRRYDADQFSSFLDGIVYDGVYGAYGNCFYVMSNESEDLGIIIDTGRAWFNHTWTLNDTYYNLTMPEADLLLDRIDAVVIEVNKEDRQNSFQVVQGTPAESPVRPTLKGRSGEVTEEIYQYAIAYIARPAASTTITQDQIVYVVDTSETPLCSALALAGIPSGGKIGQVLAKKSSESAAVDWYDWYGLPTDEWYLISGITEENVLAAYRFKGASSMEDALMNDNPGANYLLANTGVEWTQANGLHFPAKNDCYVNNSELVNNSSPIVTCVFAYSDLTDGACSGAGTTIYYNHSASQYKFFISKYGTSTQSGLSYWGSAIVKGSSPIYTARSAVKSTATLACDWNNFKIFQDGVEMAITKDTSSGWKYPAYNNSWKGYRVFTTSTNGDIVKGEMNLKCLVFYNITLTTAQHVELANKFNKL